MDDVWFGQGATRADLETCLNALSLRDKDNAPLLAVTTGGAAPRLILASRALFGLFGVTTGEALSERLLGGDDPGARRLGVLSQGLPLQGAPRLERLRFFMGPGTEIITFLCRRVPAPEGPLFIAAALGVRPGLMPAPAPENVAAPLSAAVSPQAEISSIEPSRFEPPVAAPMSVQAIQNTLRARWPANRTLRFTWHSDADMVCTQVSPSLAEVAGANGDLVGCNLLDLAPRLDPTGKLAEALGKQTTWSGLEIVWPVADAPAAVAVGLGAVPVFDRARAFDGYRGYGIVHLDRVSSHESVRLAAAPAVPEPPAPVVQVEESQAPLPQPTTPVAPNVVRFPTAKALSAEDQKTFVALGADLRQEAGLVEEPPTPEPMPVASLTAAEKRAQDVGRHGLAVFDKLGLGLLVSRDNVPIFANRHLLDSLGFADEDALHDAGGMAHLFGGEPGATAGEPVGIRGRDGRIVPASARMQRIEWDGLPATLLTLQPPHKAEAPPAAEAPVAAPVAPAPTNDAEARELRAILETATDGVVVIDGACNILSLNRSVEALLGCDRGTVVGKPFLDLFAAHNRNLASGYFDGLKSNATKRLLNDGRELLVNAAQGGTIPVFMTLGRVSGEDAPGGARFCALFRDLTHWKKVEQDLEAARHDAVRANDLKSDFLAKVSHEVRTPLNAIIGFAEVMMEERFGPVGSERYKDYLRDIHGSGTHVMSLVNDLLDLSKIEAGKMELAIDAIDANKVIGECVALMQPQASRERIIMRLSLAPSLPRIKADERSLRQIVLNILSNAVKFNEPGGQVIVATATTETGHMVIRIRDTGPGMSESDISAALEPFRQLATARPGIGGTGLGLPLTKALVEANQATFSIRSKVEQGTLVEVAFPPARVLAA